MSIVLITQQRQDNVVRVVNELRPGNREVIVRFLAGSTTFFFFFLNCSDRLWYRNNLIFIGYLWVFPRA